MESNDPDLRPSKMWPTLRWSDSSDASGTVARLVVSMFWPLATWTDGPSVVGSTLVQWGSAAGPGIVASGSGVGGGGRICNMIFRWDYDMAVVEI